ncbi:EEF1AKMT4-ECE2 readthrough transcript protein-like [Pieris brassicae]|uniref:EEF1AKMT4-ECE2 readthrough transcript protein-like n=1 Tax=Pieris brassicae TaxID=7116 RepID=UPI001E65E2ED|nr:EEF1AKMT4-ECE2 readthrough transcript protein-like [Pieris brassicae]
MDAWQGEGDGMGPSVTRTGSALASTPTLKNGSDLRESGYLIAVGSRTARFRRKHKNKIMITFLFICLLLLLCLFITMTVLYVKQKRHRPEIVCESKECLRSAANLALSMDRSADPCYDFYQYVCGNWAEEHPRPDAYHSYDWFRDKQTKVYTVVRDFLSRNTSLQPKPVQQAKDLYASCMDTETLDKRGLKPIIKILEQLALPSHPSFLNITEMDYTNFTFDWVESVIQIKTQLSMDVLIGFDIVTDPKNSSVYRLIMGSPETTNPFPSMLNENKRKHRFKQENMIQRNLINARHAQKIDEDQEAEVYKMFYAHLIKLFLLDDDVRSNFTEAELDQLIVHTADAFYSMSVDMYELESDNSTNVDELYLNIPDYTVDDVQKYTDSIVEINNETFSPIWRRYLEGVFEISDVRLDFGNEKILISEPDLKYMSLMAAYLSKMPPVLIELFVWMKVVEVMAVHTSSELRALYERASEELQSGHMTLSRSLHCANAVNDLLGMAVSYAIVDQNFFNNTKPKIETMLNELKNALAHLVGVAKWMDDDTKLATYKKIVEMKTLVGFPDCSLNYGSLGAVLGHEITHGFDNFGRQFDKNGNLIPWWSNDTIKSFVNMTQCFVDQYSSFYVPQIGKHVDGKKTLGENIADNGGVKEAYAALKAHLRKTSPELKLAGFEYFTSEQLFFLSYGNLWCGVTTIEALKADMEDEHTPQHLRARGALQNNPDFAKTWHCPPGSPMNPNKRCIIF